MAVGQHKHILRAHSTFPLTHSEKNKQFHKICGKNGRNNVGKYLNISAGTKGKRTTAGGKRKMQNKQNIFRWVAKKRENEGEPGDETLCRQRKYTPKSG